MAAGFLFAAAGFAVFLTLDVNSGFWTFFLGSVIFSLGLAPVFTLAIDLIVGVAPAERAGAASAIAETSAELGGAVGIAVFGSIGVAIYRDGIAEGLPGGVPAGAAAAARDTLGGAVEVARGLPDRLSAPLLDAANAAFLDGIHVSAVISVIGAVALAIFVWLLLRPAGIGAQPIAEDAEQLEHVA
jgi:DHA2 family multidrug resistance protein-like MFS transporter